MAKQRKEAPPVAFHVRLNTTQKLTVVVAAIFVILIAVVTAYSDQVPVGILGTFLQLLGVIVLGMGLIKTNDELVELGSHHVEFDSHEFIRHLTKDRFFIVLGVFLIALGLLLQIVGNQFGT